MNISGRSDTAPEATCTLDEDVGAAALARIHQQLLIDDEWTDRRDRGFTWWAHRLAQQIDAGIPIDDDGIVITRITSRVPVVKNIRVATAKVHATLAGLNLFADSYRYVYDAQQRRVESVQSVILHAQTLGWRADLTASFFLVQLIHAEADARELARQLRGRIAVSNHPIQGRRRVPDDMLNVVRDVFQVTTAAENGFTNRFEFETICEQVNRINAVSLGASDTGLAIEVPFADSTALIVLQAGERCPRIGAGLGVRLHLPMRVDFGQAVHLAAWLNGREAAGELLSHGIGAWSTRASADDYIVVHSSFIPAALYRSGLAMDAATGAIHKLKQLNALMNPNVPEPDVREIVANRLTLASRNAADAATSAAEPVAAAGETVH